MKTRSWIILFLLIAAMCLAAVFMTSGVEDAARVEILSNGESIAILPLNIDQEIDVDGHNTVTIKDGKVAVTWADCPDKYCMARGYQSGGRDIVCLPNRLVIRFLGPQSVDISVG